MWQPHIFESVKCDSDGAAVGLNGLAACGGIFRNMNAYHLGSFAVNIDNGNALEPELIGAILAVEIAYQNNWAKLWLETDSKLVVAAFKSNPSVVPWQLRQRWKNCLHLISSMDFCVTHL